MAGNRRNVLARGKTNSGAGELGRLGGAEVMIARLSLTIVVAHVAIFLAGCDRSSRDCATRNDARVTMECERYRVQEGRKVDRTIFTIAFSPENDHLTYRKGSGPDWIIPNETDLELIWKSKDELRFVAKWIDSRYEKDDKVGIPGFQWQNRVVR